MVDITMCFTCIFSLCPPSSCPHKIYSYPILQMKKLRQRVDNVSKTTPRFEQLAAFCTRRSEVPFSTNNSAFGDSKHNRNQSEPSW